MDWVVCGCKKIDDRLRLKDTKSPWEELPYS